MHLNKIKSRVVLFAVLRYYKGKGISLKYGMPFNNDEK